GRQHRMSHDHLLETAPMVLQRGAARLPYACGRHRGSPRARLGAAAAPGSERSADMSAVDEVSPARIRPAGPDDVPTLLEFIRQLAAYEQLSHQVVATEAQLREHLFGERPVAEA